jgi:hypothetical protein
MLIRLRNKPDNDCAVTPTVYPEPTDNDSADTPAIYKSDNDRADTHTICHQPTNRADTPAIPITRRLYRTATYHRQTDSAAMPAIMILIALIRLRSTDQMIVPIRLRLTDRLIDKLYT